MLHPKLSNHKERKMTDKNLSLKLYEIGAIQFGEFLLKNGQKSSIYINLRKIISYPILLQQISNAMHEQLKKAPHYQLVCGVPYTALPIATTYSLAFDIPLIMRRKEKKEYGTKQMIEGVYKTGQKTLVIEDVITTGGSILETTHDLEEAGIEVAAVIAVIDREQGGKQKLKEKYNVFTLFSISDTLNTLLQSQVLNANERALIQQFLLERTKI